MKTSLNKHLLLQQAVQDVVVMAEQLEQMQEQGQVVPVLMDLLAVYPFP